MSNVARLKRVEILRGAIEKIVRMLSGKNIPVYQFGSQAYVKWSEQTMEAQSVHLPVIPDDASDEFLTAIQGFLDHEVAHILYSDFLQVVEAKQLGVASLHNQTEDCFIESKMAKDFSGSSSNLEKMRGVFLEKYTQPALDKLDENASTLQYWNILGIVAMRAWSGQSVFQRFMDENNLWEKIEEVVNKLDDVKGAFATMQSSTDALNLALQVKKRLYENNDPSEEGESDEESEGEQSSSGDKQKSKPQSKPQEEPEEESQEEDESEEKGENSEDQGKSEEEDESDEDPKENEISEPESDEEAEEEEDSQEEGESEEEDSGENEESDDSGEDEESDDSGEDDSEEEQGNGLDEDDSGQQPSSEDNDDTDLTDTHSSKPLFEPSDMERIQDFDSALERELKNLSTSNVSKSNTLPVTKDWDIIQTFTVDKDYRDRVKETESQIEEEVGKHIAPMQREMERMFVAANKSRWEGGKRSGKINASALARMAAGDDRIFRRREVTKTKDVAVSLVIDCSGSMCGGRIYNAIATAWAMSQVLDRIGVTHEIVGFTTLPNEKVDYYNSYAQVEKLIGKIPDRVKEALSSYDQMPDDEKKSYFRQQPVFMPIFKGYAESFSNPVKERMALYGRSEGLMHYNADGDALLYAANRLLSQKEPGKTMIVLSDGQPAFDHGRTGVKPSTQLKKVVKMLSDGGINMVGIGINTKSVNEYYPKSVVVDKLDDLPKKVMGELRKVILQN